MNAIQMAQVAKEAIETIGKLASVADEHAPAALAAIKAVIEALRDGFDGKLSPQVVLTQIEDLHHQLASNDADALAELRARFRP